MIKPRGLAFSCVAHISFPCWFRDNNPALTSNFTDGLSITFL